MQQAALTSSNWSKLSRLLPWLGVAILVAGIAVFLIHRSHTVSAQQNAQNKAAQASYRAPVTPKKVPLETAARITAAKFILDAVQRKNLAAAWKLAGPEMRQGITYKQWLTGDIPVVPFTGQLKNAPMAVDISRPNYAMLEVALVPKKLQQGVGGVNWLEMRAIGTGKARHWVVLSWVPRYAPPIPKNPGTLGG